MDYIVMKIGPGNLAFYGPFTAEQAETVRAAATAPEHGWTASVQPLRPVADG